MSCDNASAPLDLVTDLNALDKCNVICNYQANYAACRGVAKNKGIFINKILIPKEYIMLTTSNRILRQR